MNPTILLAALRAIGGAFWSFASSRAGQIVIAFAVAWFWSGHRHDRAWQARIATEKAAAEAAYSAEVARQADAARDIAAAATARAEDDAAVERALRRQIEAFDNREPASVQPLARIVRIPGPPRAVPGAHPALRGCLIDGDFARVVRGLDAAARTATPARAAGGVRKTRRTP